MVADRQVGRPQALLLLGEFLETAGGAAVLAGNLGFVDSQDRARRGYPRLVDSSRTVVVPVEPAGRVLMVRAQIASGPEARLPSRTPGARRSRVPGLPPASHTATRIQLALVEQVSPVPVLPGTVLRLVAQHAGMALPRCQRPVPVQPGMVLGRVLPGPAGVVRAGAQPVAGRGAGWKGHSSRRRCSDIGCQTLRARFARRSHQRERRRNKDR